MSRLMTRLLTPLVALLLISASPIRAASISWKYNWEPGSLTLFGDAGLKGGSITMTDQPPNTAVGNSDVSVTNIHTVSGASPNLPDQFVSTGKYSLTIQITDLASGKMGNLTFAGKLGGTFSQSNSNISNKFTGLISQQLFLGNSTYTVTIGPYTPPGPPSASNAGSISAHVDVSEAIATKNVPEPSTMALSLFGLTSLGAGWWRKRRAKIA